MGESYMDYLDRESVYQKYIEKEELTEKEINEAIKNTNILLSIEI